jgi:hypothetical protein
MQLGSTVKHKITAYTGVITGRAEYLTGCRQWCVVRSTPKDDGESAAHWFDEVDARGGS